MTTILKTSLLAIAASAMLFASPALACTFGGPCGDGSPYDNWVQERSQEQRSLDREWNSTMSGGPAYGSAHDGYGFDTYNAPSGPHRSDDE